MKREFELALAYGDVLVDNTFETEKGKYNIVICRYHGDIYFFKLRDGRILECQNLNKVGAKGGPKNG